MYNKDLTISILSRKSNNSKKLTFLTPKKLSPHNSSYNSMISHVIYWDTPGNWGIPIDVQVKLKFYSSGHRVTEF